MATARAVGCALAAGVAACMVVPVSPMGPPVWFCVPAGICVLPETEGMSAFFAAGVTLCASAGAIARAMAVATRMRDIVL